MIVAFVRPRIIALLSVYHSRDMKGEPFARTIPYQGTWACAPLIICLDFASFA